MGARSADGGEDVIEIEEGLNRLGSRLGILLLGALLTVGTAVRAETDERRILVFGDSLTWGWTPARPITPTVRYPVEDRWTTFTEAALGPGHALFVDGVNGRTTNVPDPGDPALDGAAALPGALAAHAPLDLVVVLLGTNDTKAEHERSAFEIGLGAIALIEIVGRSGAGREGGGASPRVLLIAPPPLAEAIDPKVAGDFAGAREKSLWLPTVYAAIAETAGAGFLDAGTIVSSDGIDGIHLTAEANALLGRAVADRIESLLREDR